MVRRISSPRLINRQQELESLEQTLNRACLGGSGIEFVLGEAGIGKTRLVAEIEERARERGMLALRGICVELESGELPYAPLVGAMREVEEPTLEAALAGLSPVGRSELARAFPQLIAGGHEASRPAHDQYAPARLFEFLFALVRGLAEERPLLLVLEDFHWSDQSTRDAVRFLARNLRHERVAIVVTCRNELPRSHPARVALIELTRLVRAQAVELGGLLHAGVSEQIVAILGTAPPRALVERVFEQSGGNPFYVEELLAAGRDQQDGTLPEQLADLVLMRFQRLSADAQRVVRTMAVIGRRVVDPPLLLATTGIAEPALSAAVREAVLAHVLSLAPDEEGFEGFCFRHAIVRAAVEQELLPGERAAMHAAVAESLALSVRPGSHAELAIHWHAAGDLERALLASIPAGQEAERAHAASEALGHFEQALALRAKLGGMPDGAALEPADLLKHAAVVARSTGDSKRAAAWCDEALGLFDHAAHPRRAAALLELRGLAELWRPLAALASLREAEERLPAECVAERARVLGAEGLALANAFRWAEARDRCEFALRLAQEGGAEGEEAFTRMVLGVALSFLGDPLEGEAQLRWARAVVERLDRDEDLMRVHLYLGEVLRLQGRFADAAELMCEGELAARRVGMQGSFGRYMLANAAADLFQLGRWDEAARLIEATADSEMGPVSRLTRHIAGGQLAVGRGAYGAAGDHLRRAEALCRPEDADYIAGIAAARAELALWRGVADSARGVVAAALPVVSELGDASYSPVLFWVGARAAADAVDGARADGDRRREAAAAAEAGEILAALDALLDRVATSEVAPTARWYRAMCAAEARRAAGEAAIEEWRSSAAGWDECGMPYRAAYARWRAADGQLARNSGRAAAAAELRGAHEAAVALGAAPLRDAIAGLADRARIDLEHAPRVTQATPRALPGAFGLTPRELDVLALIGRGLTNRQIGEHLFISQKTAGVHVSHILAKLDVHSRVAAAGTAHRLGLVDAPAAAGAHVAKTVGAA